VAPSASLRPIRAPRASLTDEASEGALISLDNSGHLDASGPLLVAGSSQAANSPAPSISDMASMPSHLSIRTPRASLGCFNDMSNLQNTAVWSGVTAEAANTKAAALATHLSMRGPHYEPYHRALDGQPEAGVAMHLNGASEWIAHKRAVSAMPHAEYAQEDWQDVLARKESLAVLTPGAYVAVSC
jgi:hypothetical protein